MKRPNCGDGFWRTGACCALDVRPEYEERRVACATSLPLTQIRGTAPRPRTAAQKLPREGLGLTRCRLPDLQNLPSPNNVTYV